MASRWSVLGRERERAELDRLWAAAVTGTGAVVVLDGDSGVGKTALAVTLVEAAREAGSPVWVSCVEQAVPEPQRVLDLVLAGLGATPQRTAAGGDDGGLVAVADAFVRAIVATGRPRLVVVDDVQWADEVSLRVLALAAPRLPESPMLVLATLRTGEALPAHRRAAVLTLARAVRRLPVLPLDDEAARAVADAATTRPLPRRVSQRIVAQARGNPLFLRELALLASIDQARVFDDVAVPQTVRSVLERRLAALDDQARPALERLAVCGDDLTYPLAAAVLERPVDDVLTLAALGVEAEVLQPASRGRLRFSHPLVRDTLAAGVPYPRRVTLHREIGRRLVSLAETGTHVDVAIVAGHLCAAAPGGDGALAVAWAVRAAQDAATRLAYGAAADWYGHAVTALDATPPGPGRPDRLDLLLRRGDALEAAGERAEANLAFIDAFEVARARGDADGMGRAALGLAGGSGFEISVGNDAHLSVLDRAIAALEDDHASLRSMLLARRSIAAALRESPERQRSAAQEALALARNASDEPAQCAALAALCDALSGPAHVDERLRLAGELVELAARSPDPRPLLLGLRLVAVAQLELGDVVAFDRTVDRYEAAAGGIRQPLYDWYVPLWRAMRRAMADDVPGALLLADRAEAIGLAAGSDNASLLVECLRAFLAVDTGAPRPGTFDAEGRPGIIEPWMVISNAYVAAAGGDLEVARPVADQLPHLLARVPEDSEYLPTLVQATRIVAWVGGHEPVAATLYDRLLPFRTRFVVEGIGAYVHGPVERFLALLAGILGRPERDRHAAAARSLTAAAGASRLVRLIDGEYGPRAEPHRSPSTGVLRRDGDGWVIALGGAETYVRDSLGMRDLATLVANPRTEVAALRLAGRAEPASRGEEVLDDQARAAYRRRLSVIDAEIADAQACADLGRLEKARVEREFLIAELTAAAGLAGRARRMGDDVERARTAVTARLRDAIRRIGRASPELGDHFQRSVRTGTFCAYDPPAGVRWDLTS